MKITVFTILIFLLVLAAVPSWAQDDSMIVVDTVSSMQGIEIKTSVDKAQIYVGDLVTYTLTITYDSTLELIPPPLGSNLGAFDVKDYQPDIVTKLDDGRIQSVNKFVLSTFTTGDYQVPPIPIVFKMPDGTEKALLSEAVPIKVLSLLLNAGDSTDVKPLKAQYEFKRDLTPYYIWGGVILLILLLFIIFMIYRRRKRGEAGEYVDLRPAWEIAFEKLAFLKQKNYLLENQFKPFYYELTEIVRSYYEKVYDVNFMDMTTEEFMERFKLIDLPDTVYNETETFIKHADLVKFAKFVPEHNRAENDFELAHQLIEKVRVDRVRKEEIEKMKTPPQVITSKEADETKETV